MNVWLGGSYALALFSPLLVYFPLAYNELIYILIYAN